MKCNYSCDDLVKGRIPYVSAIWWSFVTVAAVLAVVGTIGGIR